MDETVDRARMLWARGELASARLSLEALIAQEPQDPEALLLLAHVLLQSREEEKALQAYERSVLAAPRSAEALNGLARCLHALARDVEALATARAAQDLLSEGDNFRQAGPVYLTLVWCLRDLRQLREALLVAEEGLERSSDAILAQWASVVEEELAEAEKEQC
jgi:Tfp pilus assembly protein PilF